MKFFTIASGSKGNCAYIGDEKAGILVDAGVTLRMLRYALSSVGIPDTAVKGIFVTHEHIDHIKGLDVIGKVLKAPVYANMETLTAIFNRGCMPTGGECRELPVGKQALVGDMEIVSFSTSHDAVNSVGYTISAGGGKAAVCTDTGRMTKEAAAMISGCEIALIESNHDEQMLIEGSYPAYLKDRILSSRGHLSNYDCGCSCRGFAESGLKHLLLAHISEENNTPALAYKSVSGILAAAGIAVGRDYTLVTAGQWTPSEVFEI